LKQFLGRFNEIVVQIVQANDGMFVDAFVMGLGVRPFGKVRTSFNSYRYPMLEELA